MVLKNLFTILSIICKLIQYSDKYLDLKNLFYIFLLISNLIYYLSNIWCI